MALVSLRNGSVEVPELVVRNVSSTARAMSCGRLAEDASLRIRDYGGGGIELQIRSAGSTWMRSP